jgi:hypothetical protein
MTTTLDDAVTAVTGFGDARFQEGADSRQAEIDDLKAKLDAATKPPPPPPPPPPPADSLLVGWSMSKNPHPGVCGVSRVYDPADLGEIDKAVNVHKVKRIALTSKDDTKSASTVVSRLKTLVARYPGIQWDYAHENEVDRTDHRGGSDADILAWCAEHKAIQTAVHAAFPLSVVKMAIDGTSWGVHEGRTIKFLNELKRIGALPDVLAGSAYPAGRKKSPPTESPMADHIDVWIDLAVQFGIKLVSVWEIGTPLSPNYDRAALVQKWVKRFRDYALSRGITPRDFIWWDNDIGIDNRFYTDGSRDADPTKSQPAVQGKTQLSLLAA